MTNLEKIKAILGDEVFEMLRENYNSISLSKIRGGVSFEGFFADVKNISSAFVWIETTEGHDYWEEQNNKLKDQWDTFGLRQITQEEQELIFKMFVCEYMEWINSDYVMNLYFQESQLAKKVYDALYCAEGE